MKLHEPSNPAPLFIRRAQRLMRKDFVEIVKDLIPDSLSNLERLAGGFDEK
jgi:type VI secretion system protein ImpA